jgi:enoyl-CoA hydratase
VTVSPLLIDRRGPVTTLTLNRRERLNAVSLPLVLQLLAEIESLHADPSCHAVVLTGTGGAFSAGADMKEISGGRSMESGFDVALRLCWGLRRIKQPLVAAISGVAVGAGLSLACAADFRIAERNARFGAAFVRIGLSGGDGGSSYLLPRIVGWEHAADLLYTGRLIDADEALAMGLVGRIVEPGTALDHARSLAEDLARRSARERAGSKAAINFAADGASLDGALEFDARSHALVATNRTPTP